jgi:subtilase family serine protease
MQKNNHSSSLAAAALCAVTFLFATTLMPAQSSLQQLHDHVVPAVSSGKAAPVGMLPATQQLNLAITLPLRNQDEMTDLIKRQHDPASADFRKFLSVEEFTEQFGPSKDDLHAAVAFVQANGLTVSHTSTNRTVIDISGSVEQIEKTFHVMMVLYQHPTENRTFYSPDREPSLDLSVPVSRIVGLNNFSIPHPKFRRAPAGYQSDRKLTGSGPGGQYLGSDMRAAYYGHGPLNGAGQSVGLFEYDGYDISDVKGTFDGEKYTVPIKNVLVDGGKPGSDGDDGEQVLDIVQAISMAPGLKQVLVYIGPCCSDATAVDVLNRMATDNIAKQLSCSWGWNPDEAAIHPIFAEMGVQGQTFLTASGDNGAIGPGTGGALVWPADDSFQTAVGATDLTTTGPGGKWQSETAWQFSAGGLSDNGIKIPWYQVGLANASNQGSKTIRNLPDVAAEGNFDNYLCDEGSCFGGVGGTSYAAPRWAGFMALVNQQAALVGYPPIGFINPDVYAIGESSGYDNAFHDITQGNNNCCGAPKFWNAVTGYDLVTGWGTPAGPDLIYSLVRVEPPTIGSAGDATFKTGVFESFQVSATGSPNATFHESGLLPSHLTFSPSGVLSGAPAAGEEGVYHITITANNGVAPNSTQSFTLTVTK